jgi:hypothetical protein
LGIAGAPGVASADPWRATASLEPQSPAICRQADVSKLVFDFAHTGSELLGKATGGQAFSAPVATDGTVAAAITVPVDGESFDVDLTGNAMSRQLEVFNRKFSCRFRLTPLR